MTTPAAHIWKPRGGPYQPGTGAAINVTSGRAKKVLIVAASPSTSPSTGWPIGFWAAELTHPFFELMDAGFEVEIASPDGGAIAMDGYSDPRHESGYSWEDLVSMGFVNTPRLAALLDTPSRLTSTSMLHPVPLKGIPGWDAANEVEDYYRDTQQFRPGRRKAA